MNYNHLYYFYVTAKFESVTRAAEVLRVSQPSLSVQIKNFENEISKSLFEKVGRRIRLTLEGERVFKYCQKIFEAAEDFEAFLKDEHVETVQLKIGVSTQIESPFVADLLSQVYKQFGKSNFTFLINSGTQEQLAELLRNRQIDLMLTNTSVYSADYEQMAVIDMPVGLFISQKLLKSIKGISLEKNSLKKIIHSHRLGLILPSMQQRLRHEIDFYLQRFPFKSDVVLESDILSVVARAIVDGVGVGFLPYPYVAEELRINLIRPIALPEPFWSHKLIVTSRKQEKLHPALGAFVRTVSHLAMNKRSGKR